MEYVSTMLRFDYLSFMLYFFPMDISVVWIKWTKCSARLGGLGCLMRGVGIWTGLKGHLFKLWVFIFCYATILFTLLWTAVMEELEKFFRHSFIYSFIHCLKQCLACSWHFINTYFIEPVLGPVNANIIQTLSLWAQNRALCTMTFCWISSIVQW